MFCVLFSDKAFGQIDPAQTIELIEGDVKNVIQESSEWAAQVGLGLVSLQALYYLILKLLDG